MTKTQRAVIEAVIRRAEKGPSIVNLGYRDELSPERQAKIWAESWVADPLKALLENADGTMSAAELSTRI